MAFYCDLQSLNSEDAITWSVFGNLAYLPGLKRCAVWSGILALLGERPMDSIPTCWLWRRLPHPLKEQSSGGPEIDFGCLDEKTLILGEAKWNSPLGRGQGPAKDQSQLDLRRAYLQLLAPKAFPEAERRIVLGVGRRADLFTDSPGPGIHCLTWKQVIECFDGRLRDELLEYLEWKTDFATVLSPAVN